MDDSLEAPDRWMLSIFADSSCLSKDELIAYAAGQMADEAGYEIERHLIDCPLCSEAVEGIRSLHPEAAIRRNIETLQKKGLRDRRKRAKDRDWRPYYAAAAAVMLLLASLFYALTREPAHIRIFHRYFEPYPNRIPILRGTEPGSLLEHAMVKYEAGEYRSALEELKRHLVEKPNDVDAILYAGILHLYFEETTPSINHLNEVLNRGDRSVLEPARWYLSLAYLRSNRLDEAQKLLRTIVFGEGPFSEEGASVLKKLAR